MNGTRIDLTDARKNIKAFIDHEVAGGADATKLVVGHLFDYSLLRSFMDDIQELIDNGEPIDGIRIYFARSLRAPLIAEDYDVVLVPVEGNADFHTVFDSPVAATLPLLVGNSTPCPNVCKTKAIPCPEEA